MPGVRLTSHTTHCHSSTDLPTQPVPSQAALCIALINHTLFRLNRQENTAYFDDIILKLNIYSTKISRVSTTFNESQYV